MKIKSNQRKKEEKKGKKEERKEKKKRIRHMETIDRRKDF